MREFNVIDSATSIDQLRMRLKDNDLEKFGDAFIPEFVYDVIKRLPRFSTMRVSRVDIRTTTLANSNSVATSKMQRSF